MFDLFLKVLTGVIRFLAKIKSFREEGLRGRLTNLVRLGRKLVSSNVLDFVLTWGD